MLGLLIAHFAGHIGRRAAMTAAAAQGNLTILGVWRKPARLLMVRNGKLGRIATIRIGTTYGIAEEEVQRLATSPRRPGRPRRSEGVAQREPVEEPVIESAQ